MGTGCQHPALGVIVRPLFDIVIAVATCAIQVYLGARNVAKLSRWQICWQADNSGHMGPYPGSASQRQYRYELPREEPDHRAGSGLVPPGRCPILIALGVVGQLLWE